ncbi:carbohydrate esterase family 5 protein [Bipolaris maydis ATCC 48331]|uniref:Cutinase n=2 Tax=Cochliobolus heterostrophus TaxID=5016 RepID=M2UA39_COCH5|nr:carbohydrate esterase family 5 protein [Bipolaris maydis ATCC 48331]EMD90611.1 carbohydrate esterase family 5 protein [Bipolaris maydis C5]KAJ5023581.1 carbohydrate esterase [Bipolaris maydis]ENI09178.1 carbohydrate esterase family 5 protein [Bipolaris maydis ATCC 48331]KAJ5058477.1 cutinase-domain-containing protein [Bipolaris maydis]KAJ6206508.1 carbohydrate esterase family 5 protein [Bipolaris maydis]
MMNFLSILALAIAASATPIAIPEAGDAVVATRQIVTDRTSLTENEFSSLIGGGCKDVIFVWARGSTEAGNMGSVIGQPLGDELRREYGRDLAIEGVDYAALLSTNYLPGGTDLAAELEMRGILQDINRKCPSAVIVCGGYSQGAAVNHRAIEDLSTAVKNQIAGVVTFGDTQARRDNQQIPNFPKDKLKIFCGGAVRDTVCDGNLAAAVLLPHLSYGSDAGEAGRFLIGKINAVRGAKA